ncbi:UPF0058 family protein [Halobaculum sp. MBLA0147]|uniref:UPF0058 family protein n=1 Tax=Halobaculum sp. MBLA0147 TaxID=3079934 RepID=UPI003524D8E1
MRKNELLHVHGLLLGIAREFTERDVVADDALDTYRELGVTPMSLRAARDDHAEAVLELGGALAAAVDDGDGDEAERTPSEGGVSDGEGSDEETVDESGRVTTESS